MRRKIAAVCILGLVFATLLACRSSSGLSSPDAGTDHHAISADAADASAIAPEVVALEARVEALEALVTHATADGGYSLGATFCGATAASTGAISAPGHPRGYPAAKAKCEAVASCSRAAHMCTGDEITRTRQLGHAIPYGWFSSAYHGKYADDCGGWVSVDASGSSWGSANSSFPTSNVPDVTTCDRALPILCCN